MNWITRCRYNKVSFIGF